MALIKSCLMVIDKDHRFLTSEKNLMGKLDYENDNFEELDPSKIFLPERYEDTAALFKRVIAGENFSVERMVQTGENYVLHFVPLKNDKGEVFAGLIIALDVAESQRPEELSAKLAAIIESSDDAIISKNMEGVITSWNDSAERMFGYTREEMIGQSILKIIPEDRRNEEQYILARLKSGERIRHFETKRITKDKRILDISLSNSPIKDSTGNIMGISKIARDITGKKYAEQAMIESGERLRLALKAADLGTFDVDIVNDTLEWDTRCRELFGIYQNRPVSYNQDFLKGLHNDDRERIKLVIEKLYDKNSAEDNYDVEYRTVGFEDNKLRWVRAMGKVIFDQNEKPIRFVGVVSDISHKKQVELKKNEFIAIVSHELKTPLSSLKSYTQLLQAKSKKEHDNFSIQLLTRVEVQVNKMFSMIRDFLSMSRLEEGGLPLILEKFVLKVLIKEVISDPQFLTSRHIIKFKHNEEITVFADKDKIGQVLVNLISNAIKYSPNGGTITIGQEVKNGKVKIYVSDEGVGISAKDQKKLFNRFSRVENEQLRNVSGFGIGLFIVSEILRPHNSEIKVESEEGLGSTFFFSLDVF
jgi:two-component system, OmpR family, sensor histidine kinase VicK